MERGRDLPADWSDQVVRAYSVMRDDKYDEVLDDDDESAFWAEVGWNPDEEEDVEESWEGDPEEAISEAADDIAGAARELEPGITGDVAGIVSRVGGDLAGDELRMDRDEIAEKLERMLDSGMSLGEAVVEFQGSLRYTALFAREDYLARVAETLGLLASAGHELLGTQNLWKKGSGFSTVMRSPGDLLFELSFHTPQSWSSPGRATRPDGWEELGRD